MKRIVFFLSILFLPLFLSAQYGYTYISDRRFFSPEDLVGYDFRPDRLEVPDVREKKLTPGEYSFGISANNLYVEGEGIRGAYNINNISPTEYGFKLLLINARDARLQGHLKVIQNKWGMVEALIFRRSPNEEEVIFYLPPIPGKLNDQERDYFTDRGEVFIENTDSLWGKVIRPFFRVHLDRNIQEPLEMNDSTSIAFVREIVVEEKKKKGKKGKVQNDTIPPGPPVKLIFSTENDTLVFDESQFDPAQFKITKNYYVLIRSRLQYEDGTQEDKTWKYPIRKVVEREDELAKPDENRYQIELTPIKGDPLYLYLRGDRTVSTFEANQQLFLMRGF